ncbi:ComEC/Rec2 family competence protein [Microbacterium jejuense]|uniref:ComEC/Rec2 family competence protein n=1 Tax=Microbacterium jejuense TaxID=1263637 RepID=A0ABS7HP58_9MICO|nr:ComEC/Rec2 family competence protein [Microbacterium jejuense]MBW9094744.1 ComEC/Rec2 family competence protein [Microbacterium jejuense]
MTLARRLRLAPVAAAAWAVAAAAILLPTWSAALALVLWIAVAAVVVVVAMRRPRGMPRSRLSAAPLVAILALAAAAAAASHVAVAQPARTQVEAAALSGGRAVDVTATVVGKVERRADGSLAFDARGSAIAAGSARRASDVEVVVRVSPHDVEHPERLDVGAEVIARGSVTPGRPGERAVVTVWASRGVEVTAAPSGIAAATAGLRHGLVAAVAGLPGEGAGLVPGLAVGDTSTVSPELDAAMKASSLSHLTAVSGANCALVVGIAFGLAALLGASRGVRVGIGLAVLVGFVILVTPEPSVVRAAAMAAVAMIAVLLGRTGAGVAILALAVTLLLVLDPWLAASLGFALSVAATGALLLFARPLATGLSRGMPRALALALAIPLAAQLACGPLLVLIEPTVPVYGVLANLLAEPAAPAATVLGLAACLAAPVPWLQSGLAALAWLPASWIAASAATVASLPADALPWLEGWPGAATLAAVGAAIGAILVLPRGGPRRRRVLRGGSVVVVCLVVGGALGSAALTTVAGRWTIPGEWAVLACDVGQGDAVLLRSAGTVALVDTGPEPAALTACLDRVGVTRIDLLVLTHGDLDHRGGVPAVVGRVGTVLHGPVDGVGAAVVRSLADAGARPVEASAGMSGALGDATWRVLWPKRDSRAFGVGNDSSVVLDVRGGTIPATLLLGDLSASPQRALLASGVLDPPYALVKVAHHGSADQDAALYVAAAPAVALITVGAGNDYGHPRDETLAVLDDVGARTARTDQDGLVAVWAGRTGAAVWRERGG